MSGVAAARTTRQGCILFTDLVGFTAFTEVVGDRAAVSVLDVQATIVDDVLARDTGARIVKELGDGLMIWFGGAANGLVRSVELRVALMRAMRDGFPLSVRMGMHHGEAIERGDDLVGHAVNVASRVAELAGPGELLVSEDVVAACAEAAGAEVRPIGPTTVKGVSEPIWLYRVL